MNVNPDKINELIKNFVDLDEEGQNQLIAYSYKMLYEQSARRDIEKQNIQFNTKEDKQKEVDKLASNHLKSALDALDLLKHMNDTEKAAFFLTLKNFKEGKEKTLIDDSDITITINEKKLTTQQFLERNLNNFDLPKARDIADRIHCNIVSDMVDEKCNIDDK